VWGIQAMVAPVVLITSAAILVGGLISMYTKLYDHLRWLISERLDIVTGDHGKLLRSADLDEIEREKVDQIDRQLLGMIHRHHVLRNSALAVYASIGFQVLAVMAIAVAVLANSESWAAVAIGLVLAGTVAEVVGIVLSWLFLAKSSVAITYAVERTHGLP
jgi:hypothetical protein